MTKTYHNIIIKSCVLALLPLFSIGAAAQEASNTKVTSTTNVEETHYRGAWEIGIGALGTNWSRVTLSNFRNNTSNYQLTLDAQHLLGGAQFYVAREITPWFYIDLQGSASLAPSNIRKEEVSGTNGGKYHQLYLGGLGAQFRLTPLLQSTYVEPYLRLGINYMYRDFQTAYSGTFREDITKTAHWSMVDTWNKNGVEEGTSKSSLPISLGLGVKGWLTDCFGLGIQAEYLMPIAGKGPNFAQASASLIWRIGGKSKRQAPVVSYVELPPVEVERVVEKIVEKEVPVAQDNSKELLRLLTAVYFEFDTDDFTKVSLENLDLLARLIKQDKDGRYLIIGMTDARGSNEYNANLSNRRAKAVYHALLGRGVDPKRIKHVGVGKGASIVPVSVDHLTREGDRKVLIERVLNEKYWDAIK